MLTELLFLLCKRRVTKKGYGRVNAKQDVDENLINVMQDCEYGSIVEVVNCLCVKV
jgi:hypothetical protein